MSYVPENAAPISRGIQSYTTLPLLVNYKKTVYQSSVCHPHSLYHENFVNALLHLSVRKNNNNNNNFTLKVTGTLNIHFQLLPICCITHSQDCHVTELQITQHFSP
jgi:hypothetical protein